MPKNIVIFSDGTGQAGGINFDEARTNRTESDGRSH
jgi:hypothetical protein